MIRPIFVALCIVVVCVVIYFYGFFKGYENFAGSDSWRHLKEYPVYARKEVVEQRIMELVKDHPAELSIDTNGLKEHGEFILNISDIANSTSYSIRFSGNDSIWKTRGISDLLLMKIRSSEVDISYRTLKKARKKTYRRLLSLFEEKLIDSLKNTRNPE